MRSSVSEARFHFTNLFYEPNITAYEFLKCFFAFLRQKNVETVERNLSSFLYEEKNTHKYDAVLNSICFKYNGVNYYSDEVEDALFNLQNGGLLGKKNPSFGLIIINYTDADIRTVMKETSEEFLKTIESIASDFIML